MNQKYTERYGDIHFMLKQILSFIFVGTPFRKFFLERLSLSLFMSRIGTNHYNSPAPTDQSTFFTNFTNGSPYFHISHLTPYLNLNLFFGRKEVSCIF